jgi:potassium efflux system protein
MPTLRTFLPQPCWAVPSVVPLRPPTPRHLPAKPSSKSLDKIADRKLPEDDQKALQAVLEKTLTFLTIPEGQREEARRP